MLFCRKKDPEKIVAMASILILGGAIPLCGALLVQYGLHKPPCHFCLLQRYPYLFVIAAGIGTLLLRRGALPWRFCVAVGIFALLTTGLLGLIHTGIETGYLNYTGGCVAESGAGKTLEELRASILNAPIVACNDVAAQLFGLSMATWNSIWTAWVIGLILLQQKFEIKRYDALA